MGDKLSVWACSWLSLERDMGLIYAPVNSSFTKLQFGGEHRGPLVPNIRGQDPTFIHFMGIIGCSSFRDVLGF